MGLRPRAWFAADPGLDLCSVRPGIRKAPLRIIIDEKLARSGPPLRLAQLDLMEGATMQNITFPEMRNEVIEALRSMSDPLHQRARWGRVEEGVNYYDDLTLNVHTLYDDCQVLPSPKAAVPDVLHDAEVPAFRALDGALGPIIRELGDRPDGEYLADPRWDNVIRAASSALAVMRECDAEERL